MTKKERLVFRKMRKGLRIPQAELAKAVGIYRTKITAWENGEVDLTPEEELRIGDALDSVLAKRGIPGQLTPSQAREDSREGTVLARLRDQYGFTQAQLARRSGIDQGTISSFEKGHVDLSPVKVGQLFRALDALVDERSHVGRLSDLNPPKNPREYEKWRDRMILRSTPDFQLEVAHQAGKELWNQNRRLQEQNRILQKMVNTYDQVLCLCQELINESEAKDAKILELEKKVKDLRELYDVGTLAVATAARYEDLHEKLSTVPGEGSK